MKRLFLVLIMLSVCSLTYGGEIFGAGVDKSAPLATVKDIFLKKELRGKKVTLEGKVVSQCQSNGCWFYIKDDTGQVFVDLKKNNFSLPHMLKETVQATGVVGGSKYDIKLFATGVEVQ